MAKPNKTVFAHRQRVGRSPEVQKAIHDRMMADPSVIDMAKVQKGEMTPEEFIAKWSSK